MTNFSHLSADSFSLKSFAFDSKFKIVFLLSPLFFIQNSRHAISNEGQAVCIVPVTLISPLFLLFLWLEGVAKHFCTDESVLQLLP